MDMETQTRKPRMTFRIEINGQSTCYCASGDGPAEEVAQAWRQEAQPGAFGSLTYKFGPIESVVAVPFNLLSESNMVPISKEQKEELLAEMSEATG